MEQQLKRRLLNFIQKTNIIADQNFVDAKEREALIAELKYEMEKFYIGEYAYITKDYLQENLDLKDSEIELLNDDMEFLAEQLGDYYSVTYWDDFDELVRERIKEIKNS